jgi:hypothetical protein
MHSEGTQKEGRVKREELFHRVQPIESYCQTRISTIIPEVPGLQVS